MQRPGLILVAVGAALGIPVLGFLVVVVTSSPDPSTAVAATPTVSATVAPQPPSAPPSPAAALATSTPAADPLGPSPMPTAAPSPTPSPSSSTATRPAARPSATPPSTPPAVAPRSPAPPARKANGPVSGWSAPIVQAGQVALSRPQLKSGQRPAITVACSPSSACTVSGSTLTVAETATSVTVTWSSPATKKWTAWRTSRSL